MERKAALITLQKMLKPGDTVQTILRHTSGSGMTRAISPVVNGEDISYLVGPATFYRFNQKHGGLIMTGGGMDMGFQLVYQLSSVLFPAFVCIGDKCPSNDHSNGDRNYKRHPHTDGGYALRHRWL